MPSAGEIVINTRPLIALMAALDDLEILRALYRKVFVPFEVCEEIYAGGAEGFGIEAFEQADWLHKWPHALDLNPLLRNSLDRGEAFRYSTGFESEHRHCLY